MTLAVDFDMTLKTLGTYEYGDSQADIREYLAGFSEANGYLATEFADAVCICGGNVFRLKADGEAGVAIRHCVACGVDHIMLDGAEYLDEADLDDRICVCGLDRFEITVGVSLYRDSEDVRWMYIGCRCPACGLTGCYEEWKSEYIGYRELLEKV